MYLYLYIGGEIIMCKTSVAGIRGHEGRVARSTVLGSDVASARWQMRISCARVHDAYFMSHERHFLQK